MPPKKKGAKGKGGGLGNIVDGVDTSQMSREQLEIFVHRIREENEREREERNYFQIERDRLQNFWEITRNELEEIKAELRNKDRQIEEENERNEEDIKFYKQKVKHLQYEHQNNLTESKAENLVSLKLAKDEHIAQETELLKDKSKLKQQLREQEISYQDEIKALKIAHSEEISKVRYNFEEKSKEIEIKYKNKLEQLKLELDTKHRMELSEVEERKNCQISALIKNHQRSFNDMKNYYNDITLNNLALISSLKDEMETLRKQHEDMSKKVTELISEKQKLVVPLKKAQEEVNEYKKQLENYKKDKLSLANVKAKLYDTKKELEKLRWTNEALELRYENLNAEQDEVHKRFVRAILEVQQKNTLKNALLYKKLENLQNHGQVESNQLVPFTQVGASDSKLEEMLHNKNTIIKNLQHELETVCKAYDDLLTTCEEKLIKHGIPKDELGLPKMLQLQNARP